MISALLARNGYEVVVLESIEPVFEVLEREAIDLVVSDASRGGIDGFELVRRLRSDPAGADLPVILLTALTSIEDEFDGYLAGADAYMTKPFRARELLAAIDRHLNRAVQPRSLGRAAVSAHGTRRSG